MDKELLIQQLKEIEEDMDKINAVMGSYDKLCIYCGSDRYDGRGIIHHAQCPIRKLRDLISDLGIRFVLQA